MNTHTAPRFAAGLKGLILTAKHHDGFCLWPSKDTEHSVKNSPWKDGRGDVVKEFATACQQQGLKFGLDLSPWDRNHAEYGRPGYVEYYKNQIRELLSPYGPIFEMWFDGASGGGGYYGGQGGERKIDYNTYYDWKGVCALIRELQPGCAIWGAQYREGDRLVYADCQWGGSEGGDVGDPCWHTLNSRKLAETFSHDLARTAEATASQVRGQDARFSPQQLVDGQRDTYWATDDGVTTPDVVLAFKQPVTFNLVRLREYLPLGQRIDDWALEVWHAEKWQEVAKGTAIGACRLVRSTPHTTTKARLRITKAAACPALAEFALFAKAPQPGAAVAR